MFTFVEGLDLSNMKSRLITKELKYFICDKFSTLHLLTKADNETHQHLNTPNNTAHIPHQYLCACKGLKAA